MASGSLGCNENGDLNALERRRWGDKVYTRRFRRKGLLSSTSDNPATAAHPTAAASEPPISVVSADAEPEVPTDSSNTQLCNFKDGLQASPRESLEAPDGISLRPELELEQQRDSSSSVAVLLPEGGRDGQDAVPSDVGQPLSTGGEVAPPDLVRGGQDILSEDQEGPTPSFAGEVLPQLKSSGGLESDFPGREEPKVPEETHHEHLPDGREEFPLNSMLAPVTNSREHFQPSSNQTGLPNSREKSQLLTEGREDLTVSGGQVSLPSGGEGQHAHSHDSPVNHVIPNASEHETPTNHVNPNAHGHGSPPNHVTQIAVVNGVLKPVITMVEDRVRISVSGSASKGEIRGVKRKLETELDNVRCLFRKLELKELQVTAYDASNINCNTTYVGGGGSNYGGYIQSQLMRVHSDVGTVRHQDTRPFRHLSVSVVDNNHGVGEFVEKEKRTPKANQYYRNSEFLLGKDRLPPESNKKLKPNGAGKKNGGEVGYGWGFSTDKNRDKLFRNCNNLLQRLMKHKHAWVFNEPVDAKELNLPDYHDIIKHPMDFGTIKNRLSQNWYKSAREFAEDVRLVFRNAMTYNPKGQDVHTMAEDLSVIFEDRWSAIEKEHFPYQMYYDTGLSISIPRKPFRPPPVLLPITPNIAPTRSAPLMRTLDRSESITMSVPIDPKLKSSNGPHTGRTPIPKKPKAKDPNKRDMTYEEKQKLSTNLQSLPLEKLDAIVQIIKKRNSALSQHDDEIEVDIDSVDAETLWELDRFVTNYKKSLSKNKRKAELAQQAKAAAAQAVPVANPAPADVNTEKDHQIGENINPSSVQAEKQGENASGSSSSSSSSSDSGSSSSDSDSDSSSGYGSDAGHSPGT